MPARTSNVCSGCTLLCDDVQISCENGESLAFSANVCAAGLEWYRRRSLERRPSKGGPGESWPAGSGTRQLNCRIGSQAVSLPDAVERISQCLTAARAPLFAGMEFLSVEAQQSLARLALRTGGWIGPALDGLDPFEHSAVRHGLSRATLGDLWQFPGTAVFVTGESAWIPPRLLSRFLGSQNARWIVGSPPGPPQAASLIESLGWRQVPASQAELVAVLREFAARAGSGSTRLPEPARHAGQDCWRDELAASVLDGPAVHFILAGRQAEPGMPDPVADLLCALVSRLNRTRPASLWAVDGRHNGGSAAEVLAWTFGLPEGGLVVDGRMACCAGGETVRSRWLAGKWDLVVCFGEEENGITPMMMEAISRRSGRIAVFLGSSGHPLAAAADVHVPVAESGWDAAGDRMRFDGLTVQVGQIANTGLPSASEVLELITTAAAVRQTP